MDRSCQGIGRRAGNAHKEGKIDCRMVRSRSECVSGKSNVWSVSSFTSVNSWPVILLTALNVVRSPTCATDSLEEDYTDEIACEGRATEE